MDAWKKRFYDEYTNNEKYNISTRGLESAHRYLEICVVADKAFITYHKGTDYETYILTIMNMVFSISNNFLKHNVLYFFMSSFFFCLFFKRNR